MKSFKSLLTIVMFVVFATTSLLEAQVTDIFSPLENDDNTIVLMHFEDNFTNESSRASDGIVQGTSQFVDGLAPSANLGKVLYLSNQNARDSSSVVIGHNEDLMLREDYTIEGWFLPNNVPDVGAWWPRFPSVVGKGAWTHPVYWLQLYTMSSGLQFVSRHEDVKWEMLNTSGGLISPGQWYHFAVIHDKSEHIKAMIIHNAAGEVISSSSGIFSGKPYTNYAEDPFVINAPGANIEGLSYPQYLDMYVDEIRVSDVVRPYSFPPIFGDVVQVIEGTRVQNSYEGKDVLVEAEVKAIGTEISSVTINYQVSDGAWEMATMTAGDSSIYTYTFPGQPKGTEIKYYLKAETALGEVGVSPAGAEDTDPSYYAVGFWDDNEMTLHLDFEEGEGSPVDKSFYENETVIVGDNFSYSTDVPPGGGSYSIELNPDNSKPDTTSLKVPAPSIFMNQSTEGWTCELWAKVDSVVDNRNDIARKGEYFHRLCMTDELNYINILHALLDKSYTAYGGVLSGNYGDFTDPTGKWMKYIQGRDGYVLFFYILSAEGDTLASHEMDFSNDPSLLSEEDAIPLAIGAFQIGQWGELAMESGLHGKIDEVKWYNYSYEYEDVAIDDGLNLPKTYMLSQNYPNPFNPTTNIRFALPAAESVEISIYNLLGQQIVKLTDKKYSAGTYDVIWDGKNKYGLNVSNGIYIYRMTTKSGNFNQVRKMLLVK